MLSIVAPLYETSRDASYHHIDLISLWKVNLVLKSEILELTVKCVNLLECFQIIIEEQYLMAS